jgi:hypothetical protein
MDNKLGSFDKGKIPGINLISLNDNGKIRLNKDTKVKIIN